MRRFIPACAGNTRQRRALCHLWSVHPRMCGEHCCPFSWPACCRGSSPHVRGTPVIVLGILGQARFIPACAGNTRRVFILSAVHTVHPLMCGEHKATLSLTDNLPGSSPHVRGTLTRIVLTFPSCRFIPACAGNTFGRIKPCLLLSGSSPHVRGTLGTYLRWADGQRFIPACAGNT